MGCIGNAAEPCNSEIKKKVLIVKQVKPSEPTGSNGSYLNRQSPKSRLEAACSLLTKTSKPPFKKPRKIKR